MNIHSTDTSTTVNPRERPKGNLSSVNPILPLTGTKSVQNTPNKFNSNKKAPSITVPQIPQIGFDDDFDSITSGSDNTNTPSKLGFHSIQHQLINPSNQTNQILPNSSSSDFMQEQNNNDFMQKKIHRRSASQ